MGVLLGDGTQVNVGGSASNVQICLMIRSGLQTSINSLYTVYDFASGPVSTNSTLSPLGLEGVTVKGNYVCGTFPTLSGTNAYFPAIRAVVW